MSDDRFFSKLIVLLARRRITKHQYYYNTIVEARCNTSGQNKIASGIGTHQKKLYASYKQYYGVTANRGHSTIF